MPHSKKIVMILLLFLLFVLIACEGPNEGEIFVLKSTVLGGKTIHSIEKTFDEMKMLEEMGDPDSVEEHLDYSEITSFSIGTLVKITDVNEKHHMVRIQNIDPNIKGDMKIWIDKEKLKSVKE